LTRLLFCLTESKNVELAVPLVKFNEPSPQFLDLLNNHHTQILLGIIALHDSILVLHFPAWISLLDRKVRLAYGSFQCIHNDESSFVMILFAALLVLVRLAADYHY
jgi:hypothetical protein